MYEKLDAKDLIWRFGQGGDSHGGGWIVLE